LAEIIKDGILKNQEKDVEAIRVELKSRFHISIIIVATILIIILSIVYLTALGKFEISTFAFSAWYTCWFAADNYGQNVFIEWAVKIPLSRLSIQPFLPEEHFCSFQRPQ
jgi:hypothetical protein